MNLTNEIKETIKSAVAALDRDALYKGHRAACKEYQDLSDSAEYHLSDEGHEAYKVVNAWFHARHFVEAMIALPT